MPTPNASLGFYREIFAQKGGAKQGTIQGYEVDFMIDNFLNREHYATARSPTQL